MVIRMFENFVFKHFIIINNILLDKLKKISYNYEYEL